jgi:hypothetical protein
VDKGFAWGKSTRLEIQQTIFLEADSIEETRKHYGHPGVHSISRLLLLLGKVDAY